MVLLLRFRSVRIFLRGLCRSFGSLFRSLLTVILDRIDRKILETRLGSLLQAVFDLEHHPCSGNEGIRPEINRVRRGIFFLDNADDSRFSGQDYLGQRVGVINLAGQC